MERRLGLVYDLTAIDLTVLTNTWTDATDRTLFTALICVTKCGGHSAVRAYTLCAYFRGHLRYSPTPAPDWSDLSLTRVYQH